MKNPNTFLSEKGAAILKIEICGWECFLVKKPLETAHTNLPACVTN